MKIRNWDEHFMRSAYHWAQKSKEPRTQMGAIFVYPEDKDAFAQSYNGLPREVDDSKVERFLKENKPYYMNHAEQNGIAHCARKGRATEGSVCYVPCLPCGPCAGALINAGIIEVIIHKEYWDIESPNEIWKPTFEAALEMFNEAGVLVRYWTGYLGEEILMNGEIKKL
jgi:dCMP deaminase